MLAADAGDANAQIGRDLRSHVDTVRKWRRRYSQSGQRGWVKIRIRNTREATVGARVGPVDQRYG